jgi:hypothetical protein
MFGFGKSAQQKRIDALAAENAQLALGKRAALADLGRTAIQRDEAIDRVTQLEREIDGLGIALRGAEAQLKVFTDRRDRAKLNLRQYKPKPNGTAAAVLGVL